MLKRTGWLVYRQGRLELRFNPDSRHLEVREGKLLVISILSPFGAPSSLERCPPGYRLTWPNGVVRYYDNIGILLRDHNPKYSIKTNGKSNGHQTRVKEPRIRPNAVHTLR